MTTASKASWKCGSPCGVALPLCSGEIKSFEVTARGNGWKGYSFKETTEVVRTHIFQLEALGIALAIPTHAQSGLETENANGMSSVAIWGVILTNAGGVSTISIPGPAILNPRGLRCGARDCQAEEMPYRP
jgi:hypothetical protein